MIYIHVQSNKCCYNEKILQNFILKEQKVSKYKIFINRSYLNIYTLICYILMNKIKATKQLENKEFKVKENIVDRKSSINRICESEIYFTQILSFC